eukprot:CAMPEP_0201710586 /NCGR_PEP_ID=MMETSP0578-20130828/58706_1 /ASSEMBLY_ACC=CAM_ASM_000663 /TAXON_ID=267565 /ORGANISM="Skeletonema grethea, Strain CCMP 1804" /LENGTH=735 /DNA_ID=CAMNT_0048199617 /DNA_START=286 /DNA_END=2493 /DNA_ORIENTATION=+
MATKTLANNDIDVVMIPKYQQDNFNAMMLGATIAHRELKDDFTFDFETSYWVPRRAKDQSAEDQINYVRDATDLNAKVIMLANNAGGDVENATKRARDSGSFVVTYDSPLENGIDAGESFHVAPVDFQKTGEVMADMALKTCDEGGQFVVMGSSRSATNQVRWIQALKKALDHERYANINLVGDTYYPDKDNVEGYKKKTLEIFQLKENGTYPELSLIMIPSTSGAAASAKALFESDLCDDIKVSGLGFPPEMLRAANAGCAPQFALWDNLDLGYLAYHASHQLATSEVEGKIGETISAGRLDTRKIESDPNRENALLITLGDFFKYNKSNFGTASFIECARGGKEGVCDDKEDTGFFNTYFQDKYKSKALAIIPKVTGMISFLSSLLLASYILSSKKRRSSVFGRIMVGLSISDLFSSAMMFLSTWPMPKPKLEENRFWLPLYAAGTTETCSAQGFFLQLGLCTATFYQTTLLLYYFLTIVMERRESQIKKWEVFFHLVPCAVGLGTSIAGLVLKLYNPISRGSVCWISEFPAYCSKSLKDCERGDNAITYQWGFLYGFVCVTFLWLIIAMTTIFCKVRGVEKKSRQYSHSSSSGNSREVVMQALFFCVAYLIPWIWAPIQAGVDTADLIFTHPNADDLVIALSIANAVLFPLQGFFNFLVYLRPRYTQVTSWLANLRVVVAARDLFLELKKSPSTKQSQDVTSSEGNQTDADAVTKEDNHEKVNDVAEAEAKL